MVWFIIALVLLVAVVYLAIKAKKNEQSSGGSHGYPYAKRDSLLTAAERSFLGVLEQAVCVKYRVYAQVRLADILSVKQGAAKSVRASAQNKINSKHADFVLCNKDTLEIVCAIELDDSSHAKVQRKLRDAFFEEACRAAALPLARFPAKGAYSVHEVRSVITGLVGPVVEPDGPAVEVSQVVVSVVGEKEEALKSPVCPKCGSETVLRTVKSGVHVGNKLWGCSKYPSCRGFVSANT